MTNAARPILVQVSPELQWVLSSGALGVREEAPKHTLAPRPKLARSSQMHAGRDVKCCVNWGC